MTAERFMDIVRQSGTKKIVKLDLKRDDVIKEVVDLILHSRLAVRGNLTVKYVSDVSKRLRTTFGPLLGTVEGKSKWHHQVFQDSFLLKR